MGARNTSGSIRTRPTISRRRFRPSISVWASVIWLWGTMPRSARGRMRFSFVSATAICCSMSPTFSEIVVRSACGRADAGVEGGGVELPVPEQDLDHPDVGVALQEMRREAVAERVHRDALVELGGLGRSVAGPVELTRGDRLGGLLAGEEPAARALHPPPLPQQVEEVGREHREAVLAPLALLDPDQHAGAVDVCDFEVGDLGDAQAATMAMLRAARDFRPGAWARSSATSSGLSTTGSRSGAAIRAKRSPTPGRPSVTWTKNRSDVLARFMRA